MKRLITLVLLTLSFFAARGQTNFTTPGIPAGSISFSGTLRYVPATPDSTSSIWMSIGNKWYKIATGVQLVNNDLIATTNFQGLGTTVSKFDLNNSIHVRDTIYSGKIFLSSTIADTSRERGFEVARKVGGSYVYARFRATSEGPGAEMFTSAPGIYKQFFLRGDRNSPSYRPSNTDTSYRVWTDYEDTINRAHIITSCVGCMFNYHNGVLTASGGGGDSTIYKADGFLKSDRNVYGNGHELTFLFHNSSGGVVLSTDSVTGVYNTVSALSSSNGLTVLQMDSATMALSHSGPAQGGNLQINNNDVTLQYIRTSDGAVTGMQMGADYPSIRYVDQINHRGITEDSTSINEHGYTIYNYITKKFADSIYTAKIIGGYLPLTLSGNTTETIGSNSLYFAGSGTTGIKMFSNGSLQIGASSGQTVGSFALQIPNAVGGGFLLAGGFSIGSDGSPVAPRIQLGYVSIPTAAATTTLTGTSSYQQYFTGSTTQTVILPVVATLPLGWAVKVVNLSSGVVTVQSSGGSTVQAMAANTSAVYTSIANSGTTATAWSFQYGDLSSGGAGSAITAITGDGTASGPGSVALTLATVNSNVGSFGDATHVGAFTVNGKGLITSASSTSIQIAESQVTSLTSDLALKAPLASPTFTGTPTAPTATGGTNTTQIATTAFVQSAVSGVTVPTGANPTATAGTSFVNGSATTFMRSDAAPKVDSTVFQTVLNFFPKGDTRYLKSSVVSGLANPTATIGLSVVNGSAITGMRSDGAPALSQAIVPTWTGLHIFSITGTASSTTDYGLKITPTYNQTSTASGTDLLINRTQTAVGSGNQRLIDAQIAGTSKFIVSNLGVITLTTAGTAPAAGIMLHIANANPFALSTFNDAVSTTVSAISFYADASGNGLIGNDGAHQLQFYTASYSTPRLSISGTGIINIPNLTASSAVFTDASKNLVSGTVSQTQASADLTAQTSAGNVTTFTVGSSTATFNISTYINVTAVSVDVIQGQITYTDENNTSQTVSLANISAIGNSTYSPVTIRAKNGTVITVKTNLTTGAGSITFDTGARISQL